MHNFSDHLQDFLNPDFRKGIILSLIATWTWAFATLYTKQQAMNFNPYFSLGLQMLISAVALISFTSATGNAVPVSKIPWQSWACNCLPHCFWFVGLHSSVIYMPCKIFQPSRPLFMHILIRLLLCSAAGLYLVKKVTIFITIGGLVTLLGGTSSTKLFKAIPPPEQPETEGM